MDFCRPRAACPRGHALRDVLRQCRVGARGTVLATAAEVGRPRRWPMRTILDVIPYVFRTSCTWRHLPRDFPPWPTTLRWLLRFSRAGTFGQIAHALAVTDRERTGRGTSPTAVVVDAQAARSGGVDVAGVVDMAQPSRRRARAPHSRGYGRPLVARRHLRPHPSTTATAGSRCFALRAARDPSSLSATPIAPTQVPVPPLPPPRRSASNSSARDPGARGFAVQPRCCVVERTLAWIAFRRRLPATTKQRQAPPPLSSPSPPQ